MVHLKERIAHRTSSRASSFASRRKFLTSAGLATLAVAAPRGWSALLDSTARFAGVASPSFERIDAHAHVYNTAPQFYTMLRRLNMRVINICVFDSQEIVFETDPSRDIEAQRKSVVAVFRATHGRAPWISTFDAKTWESAGFADRVIRQLDKTFEDGALGVKVYKNIGMVYQSRTGAYLMPDDPVFDPIYEHIAAKNKTLYAHFADPSSAWRPPSAKDVQQYHLGSGDSYYMYERPGAPSKETILQARDRLLRKHPKLRVVGCHLGYMEEDVDEIAQRFDQYPNLAVDTGACVKHLVLQPWEKVRKFLLKYPDRVLYGVDLDLLPHAQPEQRLKDWENEYEKDWAYFSTDRTVPVSLKFTQFGVSRGLALPEPVLRNIFRDNAAQWVPGTVPT